MCVEWLLSYLRRLAKMKRIFSILLLLLGVVSPDVLYEAFPPTRHNKAANLKIDFERGEAFYSVS